MNKLEAPMTIGDMVKAINELIEIVNRLDSEVNMIGEAVFEATDDKIVN